MFDSRLDLCFRTNRLHLRNRLKSPYQTTTLIHQQKASLSVSKAYMLWVAPISLDAVAFNYFHFRDTFRFRINFNKKLILFGSFQQVVTLDFTKTQRWTVCPVNEDHSMRCGIKHPVLLVVRVRTPWMLVQPMFQNAVSFWNFLLMYRNL